MSREWSLAADVFATLSGDERAAIRAHGTDAYAWTERVMDAWDGELEGPRPDTASVLLVLERLVRS